MRVKDLWRDPKRAGHGKRWLAVWTSADGREHTKAFAKKTEASVYGAAQETDHLRGVGIDPRSARVTIGQWVEAVWLPGYRSRRASTVRQAEVHVRQISAEFGGMTFASVRPSHVKAWCARLQAEGYSASYVHALYRRLSQIFADAIDDEIIKSSPCSRKTSPGQGKQRAFVPSTAQVWALHDAMPERYRAAVLLGAFAGLRVAEACGLRTGDVDFMRAVIHPRVQFRSEPLKTEASRAAIPIARAMALQLSAHVQQWPGETILTDPGGGQVAPWRIEELMKKIRVSAGLPAGFRFHDTRHYYATALIASGADIKTVQARMRHASATTTLNTYGHLWPDRDESTRAAIEAIFTDRTEQDRNKIAGE